MEAGQTTRGTRSGNRMPATKQSRTRPGQKRAEESIKAVRAKGGPFVIAVEATRMPMVVTDPTVADNPIIYANAAFLEMCGYELEEVLGQNYLFLSGQKTDPQTESRILAAMSARQDLVEDMQFYRKNGAPIWVAAFIRPVVERNMVVQHFASFIDISRRVELEHELSNAKATLERRVALRTRRLEEANARLEEEVERRRRMEAVLRDTLTQREEDIRYRTFLAREVDHRTKNALQMASSLLDLQASRTADDRAREALRDARNRLMRMSEVHALLYQDENPGSIDFAAYLHRITRDLGETLQPSPGQVDLDVDADEVHWGPDLAIPLGLLVGEAITNAMKHAFPEGRKGLIRILLHAVGGGLMRLTIEDDGAGLPTKRRQGSLGMELIDIFADQIKGKVAVEPGREGGTRLDVTFADPNG